MNKINHWESIYKNKSPTEVSCYQEQPSLSLASIKNLDLAKSDRLIDMGAAAQLYVIIAAFSLGGAVKCSGLQCRQIATSIRRKTYFSYATI